MRIHCKSGENVTIMLDNNPFVQFVDLDIIISTVNNEIALPSDEALKITYLNVDPDGLSCAELSGVQFSFGEETLTVANLVPQTYVSIYAVDGRLVTSAMTDSEGCATLSLPGLTGAVYVVHASNVSFKLRRP